MNAGPQDELTILIGRVGEQYADPDDWRALIAAGRLRRFDSIAVRRPIGTVYQRAEDVPELAALFDAFDAGAPPPPPSRAPEPVAPEPTVAAPAVPVSPTREPVRVEPARARRAPPPLPPPRPADVRKPSPPPAIFPPEPRRKRGGGGRIGTLVLLALLGFGAVRVVRCAGEDGPVTAARDTVIMYATRETRIRPEPVTGNKPLSTAARGDRLVGEWTVGTDGRSRWLQLTQGRNTGGYAWGVNLAERAPPRLSEVVSAEWRTQAAGRLLAAPKVDADVLAEIGEGQRLRVAGRVGDDWVEIVRSGGGVGYAEATLFETPSGVEAAPAEEETLSVDVVG
jgi:hypothetical protein